MWKLHWKNKQKKNLAGVFIVHWIFGSTKTIQKSQWAAVGWRKKILNLKITSKTYSNVCFYFFLKIYSFRSYLLFVIICQSVLAILFCIVTPQCNTVQYKTADFSLFGRWHTIKFWFWSYKKKKFGHPLYYTSG